MGFYNCADNCDVLGELRTENEQLEEEIENFKEEIKKHGEKIRELITLLDAALLLNDEGTI